MAGIMHRRGRGGRIKRSGEPRKRKNASFLQRYGMTSTAWADFKKTATTEEVVKKRQRAFVLGSR